MKKPTKTIKLTPDSDILSEQLKRARADKEKSSLILSEIEYKKLLKDIVKLNP